MNGDRASRLLYVIAHPDDEDALTLTYLCRELGVHVSVFSLTRGEGGANIIGTERHEALGMLRTHELARACDAYGVQQLFFSSAFDYGFSRRLEEAQRAWNIDIVADELASAIEICQAPVIMSRFSGAAEDGHAHHIYCAEAVGRAVQRSSSEPMLLYGGGNHARTLLPGHIVTKALEGYREHRTQDPQRLLATGGAALCHYRSASSEASYLGQQLTQIFDSRHGPHSSQAPMPDMVEARQAVALAGIRDGAASTMYRWRSPESRLRAFAAPSGLNVGPHLDSLSAPSFVLAEPGNPVRFELGLSENCPADACVRIEDQLVPLVGQGRTRQVEFVPSTGGCLRLALVCDDQEETLVVETLSDGTQYLREAEITVVLATIEVAPVKVAYVAGDGDNVSHALACLNLQADTLTKLTGLDAYDTIIVGERAYAIDGGLMASNDQLLDFCLAGGHLIVLSQVAPFDPNYHAPWPGQCPDDAPEACDPGGALQLLESHALLHAPNKIAEVDFAHWSGGRGRKFWTHWNSNYQPLIALQDQGEPEQRGAWLTCSAGAGQYTYCALSLAQQWSGRVDPRASAGALRILANLVSWERAAPRSCSG